MARPTKWVITTRPLRGGQTTRGTATFEQLSDALNAYLDQIAAAVNVADDCCNPLYQEFITDREETQWAYYGYLMGDVMRNIKPAQVLKVIVPILGVQWLMTLARENA